MTDQDATAGAAPGPIDALAEHAVPDPAPDPDRRRRNGLACAVSALLLASLAVIGLLLALGWWDGRQSPAPADWAGTGTGAVRVEVPQGADLTRIGHLLHDGGVVASVEAFTRAAVGDPRAVSIQPGDYGLRRHMSALAALAVLTDPANAGGLVVPEGRRARQVYAALDARLGLPPGTAEHAARTRTAALGLPPYAGGRVEGFLFPARYGVAGVHDALTVLRRMVAQARTEYAADGIGTGDAAYRTLIVASLVQAEAQEPADFAKVARVIRNRLDRGMPLQLDSALNYGLGRTTLDTTHEDVRIENPYNTYLHTGLPPTPVCNPGHDAVRAALHPAPGRWLYFVTVKPGDTRFTDSYAEQQRNVADFNRYRQQHSSSPGVQGR
ncbi:endolytic transglycosylase MltG [Streptacidiphilus sp. ASG 303]|uniref:endolytic transglycosylase MltG n=1 Tax=Streptacidiphilus sp. ASG 303 TaxID=2896847 RepID=UPI001E5378BE|nr:endolytic transglycosylase MltG [Streptacidiphilus sp. ASG 303]MCD0481209.1 endolytic transglycosylase MltG [Streptacidiphilus sp. ASG 303]